MPEQATAVAERAIEIFNETFGAGQTGISAAARALYVPEPVIVPCSSRAEAKAPRYALSSMSAMH